MTVLHLTSGAGSYGAETMLMSLARALVRQGDEPIVRVFRDSRYPHIEVAEKARQQGLPVEPIPCGERRSMRCGVAGTGGRPWAARECDILLLEGLAAAILTSRNGSERSQHLACQGRRRVEQFYSGDDCLLP